MLEASPRFPGGLHPKMRLLFGGMKGPIRASEPRRNGKPDPADSPEKRKNAPAHRRVPATQTGRTPQRSESAPATGPVIIIVIDGTARISPRCHGSTGRWSEAR